MKKVPPAPGANRPKDVMGAGGQAQRTRATSHNPHCPIHGSGYN